MPPWDVSPVAPTPFGFLLLFSFLFFCVLYYKFILYITRGVPNKAMEKKKQHLIELLHVERVTFRFELDFQLDPLDGR